MHNGLLKTLVQRNLITTETIVRANIRSMGFHKGFYTAVKDVHWEPSIKADAIIDIEGMEPERFAKSYNIKPDGSSKQYKKRGRKPKISA
tara:strand:+ start:6805 stop:7074 length:270 start_codon:yes stop_codon:yes gene_type:complete